MISLQIARFTLKEAVRKRFFLMAAIVGVVFLALYAVGFHFINEEWLRNGMSQNKSGLYSTQLVMAGLFLIHLLGILVAIAVSVSSVSQEVEEGTIQLVATKPLGRWEIVAGKWLGLAALLAIYVLGMAWGILAVGYAIAGYWPPQPYLPSLLMLLAALLFMSLSLLLGSFLSTLPNALLLLTLFGIAFFGGMVEGIGAIIRSDTMVNIGIGTSLLAPSDALWRLASHLLDPSQPLTAGPFSSFTEPSSWMVLYSAVYAGAALLGATRVIAKRDL
ncbi:MAG: ABC transporter permease subunit [Dehalococcoidia bacterium]|nr:ABC transporter permease subunit [Dehalococcoidia bacterium]